MSNGKYKKIYNINKNKKISLRKKYEISRKIDSDKIHN